MILSLCCSTTVWGSDALKSRIQLGLKRRALLARDEYQSPSDFGWKAVSPLVPSPLVLDRCFQKSFPSECMKRRSGAVGDVAWLRANDRIRLTRDVRVHFKGDRWWHRVIWTQALSHGPECSAISNDLQRTLFLSLEDASRVQDQIDYSPARPCYRFVTGWVPIQDWKPLSSSQLYLLRRLDEWATPNSELSLLGQVASLPISKSTLDEISSKPSHALRREVASAMVGRCLVPPRLMREVKADRKKNGYDSFFTPAWQSKDRFASPHTEMDQLREMGWNDRARALSAAGLTDQQVRILQGLAATLVGEVEGCALDLENQKLVPGHLEMVGRVLLDRRNHRLREIDRQQPSTRFGRMGSRSASLDPWEQVLSRNRHFSVWNNDRENYGLWRALCPMTTANLKHWDRPSLLEMGYPDQVHLAAEVYDRLWLKAVDTSLYLLDEPEKFRSENIWLAGSRDRRSGRISKLFPHRHSSIYYYTHGVNIASWSDGAPAEDLESVFESLYSGNRSIASVRSRSTRKKPKRIAPFERLNDVVGINRWPFVFRRSPACQPARFWKANR